MTRYEFNSKEIEASKKLLPVLKETLEELKIPFFIDDKLLFHKKHFNGEDFTTYSTGQKKQSTLRFKEGIIRLPAKRILPVYESREFTFNEGPRAIVTIDNVVVSKLKDLTLSELASDGFQNVDHAVESMREYYPDINCESIVSLYSFGRSVFANSYE